MQGKQEAAGARVMANWAHYFAVEAALFEQPGTTFLPSKVQSSQPTMYLYQINKRTVIEYHKVSASQLQQLATQSLLNFDEIANFFGQGSVALDYTDHIFYLDKRHFTPCHVNKVCYTRMLTQSDAPALDELHGACPWSEVDNAYVEIDQDAVSGAFVADKLVAAASAYELDGFLDLGVLTHPSHRGKGLGKAAISALCSSLIDRDKLFQYRCHDSLHSSIGIAHSIGFTKYFEMQAVVLKADKG